MLDSNVREVTRRYWTSEQFFGLTGLLTALLAIIVSFWQTALLAGELKTPYRSILYAEQISAISELTGAAIQVRDAWDSLRAEADRTMVESGFATSNEKTTKAALESFARQAEEFRVAYYKYFILLPQDFNRSLQTMLEAVARGRAAFCEPNLLLRRVLSEADAFSEVHGRQPTQRAEQLAIYQKEDCLRDLTVFEAAFDRFGQTVRATLGVEDLVAGTRERLGDAPAALSGLQP